MSVQPVHDNSNSVNRSHRRWTENSIFRNKDCATRLLQMLNGMRRCGQLCDVILIAGVSPEERAEADTQMVEERVELSVHRAVLAASSPYFCAMFTAEMAESRQQRIFIQEVNPRALALLVDYMYTSEIHITEDNVQDRPPIISQIDYRTHKSLLPAANFLRICDVANACCEFLKSRLHPSNCLGIRAFADIHSCDELLVTTSNFIEQNFGDVVQGEEFHALTSDQLIHLIASDRLIVPNEEKVFESVMQWVRFDLDSRKNMLPRIMEHVRLPLLSQEYLVEKVDSDPIVRENPTCKDYLIEALKFHLMKEEQKRQFFCPRARPRTPLGLPKLMIVIGGQAPKAIRNVDVFDFQTDRWLALAELPMRRCRCGVAVVNGLVYAVGGFNGSLRVRTVDVYDPLRDAWTQAPSMEARRSTLGVGVLEGSVYAVGGFDGTTGLNSAEALDPRSGEWRILAAMSTRRSSVGVAVLNGCVYAIGGYDGLTRQCLSTVEKYEPRCNAWIPVADMTMRRSGPGVAALDGKLYTLGGHDGPNVKKSAEVFDPDQESWRPIADMTLCRRNAGVCSIGGLLYSVGGDDGTSNLASVETYSPSSDQWTMLANSMHIGRSYAGVAIINKPSP